MAQLQFQLSQPPADGITCVRFARNDNTLLVSSWDSGVRLYDISSNTLRSKYYHKAGVLDCCFGEDTQAFSGSVDKTVKMYDFPSGSEHILGTHERGVKAVEYNMGRGVLISGSWDKTIRLWDTRARNFISSHDQPDKVFTMTTSGDRIVVGTAGRHVNIYDMRQMSEPEQSRESSLKYQTRCIKAFPDGTGYTLSSIEGRVAVEWFDPSPASQSRKYAFKCHRANQEGVDHVYPVNTMAFHPQLGTFATGGCDAVVNIWDPVNKKRLCQLQRFPTSIASVCFNHDGTLLAIASSYTFEQGDIDHPPDTIYIRSVQEQDVKPRGPGAPAAPPPPPAPAGFPPMRGPAPPFGMPGMPHMMPGGPMGGPPPMGGPMPGPGGFPGAPPPFMFGGAPGGAPMGGPMPGGYPGAPYPGGPFPLPGMPGGQPPAPGFGGPMPPYR